MAGVSNLLRLYLFILSPLAETVFFLSLASMLVYYSHLAFVGFCIATTI